MKDRELVGKANHVCSKDEIITLDVHQYIPEGDKEALFISIRDGEHSVLVYSIEQWDQLDAIVRKAFDNMSDE